MNINNILWRIQETEKERIVLQNYQMDFFVTRCGCFSVFLSRNELVIFC